MNDFDVESVATRAVQQARLLVHRTELIANTATHQAAVLLYDQGMSHRQIAKLTGLSKSDVARKVAGRPPLGVAQRKGGDSRINDFAREWIWGNPETEQHVVERLLGDQEASEPAKPPRTMHEGYSGPLPTNFGGTNRPPDEQSE